MKRLLKFFILYFLISVFIFAEKIEFEYVPDQIIVRFKKDFPKIGVYSISSEYNIQELKSFNIVEDLYLFKIMDGKSVKEKIDQLKKNENVLYAEPNYIRKAQIIPNDQYFNYQWGLHNVGQSIGGVPGTYDADINAPEGWDETYGDTSIVVAVIDTGVDYTHSDLIENMWKNPFEIPDNGIDDDGNGYIDDIYGINAITGSGNPMDDNGHGTHCAGIIGAIGNNNVGVCGVNWKVSIMALKFLSSSGGGTDADAIECIQYVVNMKKKGVNIIATNNSWGGYGESKALLDAIEELLNNGILFIAASGNDSINVDYNPFFPGGVYLPNVISVSATDKNDGLAYFSNYGRHKVSVGAPGHEIYSTFPSNNYYWASGTSMATPFVAGLSALIKSKYKNYDWIKIKNLILTGGKNLSSLYNKTTTGKIIRVDRSLLPANNIVLARLRPIGDKVSCHNEDKVEMSVLHIKNESGNGNVNVNVLETGETITLLDNGIGFDKTSGDGIYSSQWQAPSTGKYTIVFPGNDIVEAYVLNKYDFQTTSYNWREITGINLNLEDESVKKINSPFPIKFGDYSGFNEIYINSNGVITFFDDIMSYYLTLLLLPFPIPDNSINIQICPFRDDFNPSGNNNVYWAVIGNPPNRELVIEWRNVPHYPNIGNATFQVVFFENKSDILFNYKDVYFGDNRYDKGAYACVGIQISKEEGKMYSWLSPSLENNTSVLWKTEYVPPQVGIPDQPINLYPENGAQNISLTPELIASSYSHPDNIPFTSSQWQIRRQDQTYQNPIYDSGEIGPVTSHLVPSGILNFSTTYFWRVRYKDSNENFSLWSEETSFTTSPNRPPERPTNYLPENEARDISLNPVLYASKFQDPDGDILYIAQWRIREDGKTEYKWQTQNSSNSVEIPIGVLEYNKKYFWQVRYSDPYNNFSDWSYETSFTTQSPIQSSPSKPFNISPYNGQSNIDLNPILCATGFSDPDGDSMDDSEWQIREENGSYISPYWQKFGGAITSIQVDRQLQYNKKYYWRVRYKDINENWSYWSDETYFITKSQSIEQPVGTQSSGGGCFIATLCFGEGSWQVRLLKELRDKVLMNSLLGKRFIKFYYRYSPIIADYLKTKLVLRNLIKFFIYSIVIIPFLIVKKFIFFVILIFLIKWLTDCYGRIKLLKEDKDEI